MFFGYSWDIFAIKAKNPTLSFSIHPVPALTNPVTIASYWAEGVSSKTKHQKEAMLFLTFLTKKETEQQLFTIESKTRLFGELPARRDLGQLVSKNPLLDPFLKQAEYAVSSYYVSDTFDNGLNDQLNVYLGNAVRAILGNTSVESATDTFVKGATQVLKRYGIN
jgi:multiple sugar transport system substrate-binding protein